MNDEQDRSDGTLGGIPTAPPRGRPADDEDDEPDMAGQEDFIDGRYRLEKRIGVGGFGEVWKVCDTRFEHPMALKLLKPRPGTGRIAEDDRRRFLREARKAKQFNGQHNIVQIQDVGEHQGRPFLVMPLLDGETLSSLLKKGPLDPPRAVSIVQRIGVALTAIHGKDLVHRDVKPANVFIGPDDTVTLLDFGIIGAWKPGEISEITRHGEYPGTTAYMAPERLWGEKGEDPVAPSSRAGDLYSLACVLHECLTTVPAFAGNDFQLWYQHRTSSRPRPSAKDGDLRDFDRVVGHGLAVAPDDRPEDVDAFVEEVGHALDAWRKRVRRPPPPDPSPLTFILVGGASTGIVGAGAVALAGTSSVTGGLAIAASWAAGACLGWWYGSRGPT